MRGVWVALDLNVAPLARSASIRVSLGIMPDRPLPYFGWAISPDQYQRRWDGDDGESTPPLRPRQLHSDLPPLLQGCGHDRDA